MEFLKGLTNERKNSIGMVLLAGAMAASGRHIFGMSLPYVIRKIEQKRLEEGRYLSNSNSIERCNRVIEYYEDVFGTFEWAH